jgi:hypothetical protein
MLTPLAVALLATACGYFATVIPVEDEVSVTLKNDAAHAYDHPLSLTPRDLTILFQSVQVTFNANWIQRLITGPLRPEPLFDESTLPRVVPGLVEALEKAGPRDRIVFYVARRRSEVRRDVTSGTVFVKDGLFHLVLANYQNRVDVLPGLPEYDRKDPEVAIAPQRMALAFDRPDFLGAREQDIVDGVFGAAPPRLLIDYARFLKMSAGAD